MSFDLNKEPKIYIDTLLTLDFLEDDSMLGVGLYEASPNGAFSENI